MSLFFLREGQLLLVHEGLGYHFDTLSEISFSQIFKEETREVDTLHSPNKMSDGKITERNKGTFSATIYPTSKEADMVVWSCFGFTAEDGLVTLNSSPEANQTTVMYFKFQGLVYKLNNWALSNITVNISHNNVVTYELSADYSYDEIVTEAPNITYTNLGKDYYLPKKILATAAGNGLRLTGNIVLEFSRDLYWLDRNTIHNTGIYYPDTYVVKDLSIAGSFTEYLRTATAAAYYDGAIEIEAGSFKITLNKCNFTERDSMATVLYRTTDFRVLDAANSFISYRG